MSGVSFVIIKYHGPLQTYKDENKELQKDKKAIQKELNIVRSRNEELHRENLHYKEIIDPIRKKAEQIYPELETSAAISKLAEDLSRVSALATRDIYRPLDSKIRKRLVSDLRKVIEQYGLFYVRVIINHQYGTTNRKELAEEIVQILQSVGITAETDVRIIIYTSTPPSIAINFNPEDLELLESFWSTLKRFINLKPTANRKKDFDKGTFEFVINDEPLFLPNGVVMFR